MKAWYFAANNKRLRHGDNRVVRRGATHKVDGDPKLCSNGLHASLRLIDALGYAPGPIICRVKLGGSMAHGSDKLCATERTYLQVLPKAKSEAVLREFTRKAALRVIGLWDAPEVVVKWLKTGDPALQAQAYSAAAAAADAAADAAAYSAARAARAAADADAADAAADAADAAAADADAAADAAAADAAYAARAAAEKEWQNKTLTRLANKAMRNDR